MKSPVRRLKDWLSAAIDWRVREEVGHERKVLEALSKTVAQVSSELTDEQRLVSRTLEDLILRLEQIEKKLN